VYRQLSGKLTDCIDIIIRRALATAVTKSQK
jgi:hypothetical protein